jgi:hypothetical protein
VKACQRRISALLSGTPAWHYATGEEAADEIESPWTARRREQLGVYPVVRRRDVSQKPRSLAQNAIRAGHALLCAVKASPARMNQVPASF